MIEVISGQTLDAFFEERIFGPLGMTDTGFGAKDPARLAALYTPGLIRNDAHGRRAGRTFLSGGGGLVSTAADYHRFTRMLLADGRAAARDRVRCASWPATTCRAAPS